MEKKQVTIYSLAEELDLSPSMVSRAFNPDANVDEEKRKRILEAAERYHFKPNRYASRLSRSIIRIGVLIRVSYSPVADSLCSGIETAYQMLKDLKVEYTVVRVPREKKLPEECGEELEQFNGYDGVIISGFSSDNCIPMLTDFARRNPNLVFLQSANQAVPYLFASKHNERAAAMLAAEFLYRCLRTVPEAERNILLFTGKSSTLLHKNAAEQFRIGCDEYGLKLLETVDMEDDETVLKQKIPEVFSRYPLESVRGIYITSGNSVSLCEYLEKEHYKGDLVTFDLYSEHRKYLNSGLISATIYQNLEEQGQKAFSQLVHAVVTGTCPPKTVYTDVELILRSNVPSVPTED